MSPPQKKEKRFHFLKGATLITLLNFSSFKYTSLSQFSIFSLSKLNSLVKIPPTHSFDLFLLILLNPNFGLKFSLITSNFLTWCLLLAKKTFTSTHIFKLGHFLSISISPKLWHFSRRFLSGWQLCDVILLSGWFLGAKSLSKLLNFTMPKCDFSEFSKLIGHLVLFNFSPKLTQFLGRLFT